MADKSKIEWTHSTFNPWVGCTKVSAGCANCYAEALMDTRYGKVQWGDKGTRVRTSAAYWRQPLKWRREAKEAGERRRVFCASLADVGEDRPELEEWRSDLSKVIRVTDDALDWLLLTKRPENLTRLFPRDVLLRCWLGTSVENQDQADKRIPELLKCPAAVRFISAEPLLGPIDLSPWRWLRRDGKAAIGWLIAGGESGSGARPCNVEWIRDIVRQCQAAGTPVFVKQLGKHPFVETTTAKVFIEMKDRKGGDPDEWPADLRVRQFPVLSGATP